MKQLLDKELQKQEYSKALRDQMQLNSEKKTLELQLRKKQEDKLDRQIHDYYQKIEQQTLSDNLFKKYDQIPAAVAVRNDNPQKDLQQP